MEKFNEIIDKVINIVKRNKFIVIIAMAVLVAFIVVVSIVNKIRINKINNTPIVSIEVVCDHEFDTDEKFNKNLEYFKVTAHREGNIESELSTSNITFSQNHVNPYGKTTTVEITYVDENDKEYKCNTEVQNKRDKIVSFECGYPNVEKVVAVLYSNGELCFEGSGDTLVFYENEYPWLTEWWEDEDIDEESVPEIKSVTFEEGITPTNLNYAFENCESLIYIDKIPSTVRTMVKTFAGCANLKNAADLSDANALLNMNYTYQGCTSLINSDIIPPNVRVANYTFEGCKNLQVGADMSNAENLVLINHMYENCHNLTSIVLRDGIKSMKYTFSECINLKFVTNFPTTVKYMDSTFSGCVSLSKFEYVIPSCVQDLSHCFSNCEILSGEIIVECNASYFEDMFLGACHATKINLKGNSMLLDAYANTNDMENAYVNGLKPNTSIVGYEDIFE